MTSLPSPVLAAIGVAETVLARLAAGVLPWTQRSQQDAWRRGYIDGLTDAMQRQERTP